jgi:hypothetical protein
MQIRCISKIYDVISSEIGRWENCAAHLCKHTLLLLEDFLPLPTSHLTRTGIVCDLALFLYPEKVGSYIFLLKGYLWPQLVPTSVSSAVVASCGELNIVLT